MKPQKASQKELIQKGKFIALVLRHKPDTIGLTLDSKGRAKIDDLIKGMNDYGVSMDRETLDQIVETNNKKRYVIDGDYIYAAQGHSIKEVEVELEEKRPPYLLYHGTIEESVQQILNKKQGIKAQNRNHVHLSDALETATTVGSRRGKPVILVISARAMPTDGYKFYLSKNNVWLTDFVPAKYIIRNPT